MGNVVACAPDMNRIEKLIRVGFSSVSAHLKTKEYSSHYTTPSETISDNPPNLSSQHEAAIKTALNECTGTDINLFECIRSLKSSAPCGYIHIMDNKWFSLGVFVVFQNHRLPLHDHPGMFGAIKAIHGKLRVKSYSVVESLGKMVKVCEEPSVDIDSNSEPVTLQPNNKNIHEIEFLSGEGEQEGSQRPYAAFIDFLTPPYNDEGAEPCNYYEIHNLFTHKSNTGKSIVTLRKCTAPTSYWSVNIPYQGLPFNNLLEQLENEYPACRSGYELSSMDTIQ